MQAELSSKATLATRLGLQKRVLVFILLFAMALGVRLYRIGEPPQNFHATRQYRSLLIARGFYYETRSPVPQWQREVVRISLERQGILEPPILEAIVAAGYRLAGGEHLWLPQLLSSLFWLAGGFFLYRIARNITDETGALAAIALYLFLPFSAIASRSIQPDPLMVMAVLAGCWAILRAEKQPSSSRFVTAAVLSAFAFLVKPVSLFLLMGVYASLRISQHGLRRGLANRRSLLFICIVVAPTLLVYAYGTINGSFLIGVAQKMVLPRVLLTSFFWRRWINNINAVLGMSFFVAGLLGVFLVPKGKPRALVVGLWSGYVIFCLAFNYNVATHDYYHLPLIPIASLSIAPMVSLFSRFVLENNREWYWRAALLFVALMVFSLGLERAMARLAAPDARKSVQAAEEIGAIVDHSTQVIYLASDYGVSLEYHGFLSGKPWPLMSDLEWERLAGVDQLGVGKRFLEWFSSESPEYFVITDFREFEQQAALQPFLEDKFSAVARTDEYIIYDLRAENATLR